MTRAEQLIVHTLMSSFDVCHLDDDFVTQVEVPTKSGLYLFTIEDGFVTITNEANKVNKKIKFKPFLQYLKGFSEPFEDNAHRIKPTRGLDMTLIEVNLTRNEELFLTEIALVALREKADLIDGDDAISFTDSQARALLTTLTSKRVLSKSPGDKGVEYRITDTGYKILGYESPVKKVKHKIKKSVNGKPTKSIAEEFGNVSPVEKKAGGSNPRTEYPKGETPTDEQYQEVLIDLEKDLRKQPLCRALIKANFDNATIEKAIKEIMDISYVSADVNKQRRAMNRRGEFE